MKGIFFTLLLISNLAFAQNFQWAKRFSGNSVKNAKSIFLDKDGNIFTTGYFAGTVDFDPGLTTSNLTSNGSRDVFVTKMDSAGDFIWAIQFGSTYNDEGNAIAIDTSGYIYLAGNFGGTVDFELGGGVTNLISGGNEDMFFMKMNPNTSLSWVKRIGGAGYEKTNAMVLDDSANVYMTGSFQGTVDFNPLGAVNNLTVSGTGTFLSKYNASGSYVSAIFLPLAEGEDLVFDSAFNIHLIGNYGYNFLTVVNNGDFDVSILKYDRNFNLKWVRGFGGTGTDIGTSVAVDQLGNVYSTGYFENTVDFNPGTGVSNLVGAGAQEMFISKLDSSGNFIWAKCTQGNMFTSLDPASMTVDMFGAVYITGKFIGTHDFDPSASVYNLMAYSTTRDIFIAKYDSTGIIQWAGKVAGTAEDNGNKIILDNSGNIYAVGYYTGLSIDFDMSTGVFSLSGTDNAFILKMWQCIVPATPSSVLGNSPICEGSTVTYSIVSIPNALSYTWTLPSGWIGSSSDTSIVITCSTTGGLIGVTAINGLCSSSEQTLPVVVNLIPAMPTAINGNTVVCESSSNLYSVSSVSGATNYTWTLPAGWSGTSTGTSINSTAGSTGGTITITANNGSCSSPTQNKNVSVNVLPAVPTITESVAGTLHSSAVSGNQWYKNAVLIAGATSQDYVYTTSGTYTVKTTISGCSSLSLGYDATISGMSSDSNQNEWTISIYPNPISDELNISSNFEIISLQIIDLTGREIFTQTDRSKINLTTLTSGIYFLKVTSPQEIKSFKIVIN